MADAYKLDGRPWQNRIIGHDNVPPDSLLANEANWRIHPKNQQDAMTGALDEIGWIDDVIVNLRRGEEWPDNDRGVATLLDGHLRVSLALRNNVPTIPVKYVDLSPAQERLALATFDPIAAMAAVDHDMLSALLADIETADAGLQAMLAELAAETAVNGQGESRDAEPQTNRAEELRQQWQVEPGQMWILPSRTPGQEHRLICGDCTDGDVVARVMGGERVMFVLTDPPYGINLPTDYRTSRENSVNRMKESANPYDRNHAWFPKTHPPIVGDDQPFDPGHLLEYPMLMLWGANNYTDKLPARYSWLVWDKKTERGARNNFGDCELCWCSGLGFDSVRIFRHMWTGYQRDSEVGKGSYHPTQKPVLLMEWCLSFAPDEGVVCDWYAGSGPTIIAAENLARQCRAVEISPSYTAVCLQRYLDAFGIRAELTP